MGGLWVAAVIAMSVTGGKSYAYDIQMIQKQSKRRLAMIASWVD